MALAALQEVVNVVRGTAIIEGVLMKCETGTITNEGRPPTTYYSIQLEHAGNPVKVPSSLDVYLQLKDCVAMPVRIHCNVKPMLDKTARDGRGAGAMRLQYDAHRGEVLAHDGANEGLNLPGEGGDAGKKKKAGW